MNLYSVMAVVYLLISRSLQNNGCICHNIHIDSLSLVNDSALVILLPFRPTFLRYGCALCDNTVIPTSSCFQYMGHFVINDP
jgi:hypothetical protein